MTMLCDVKWGKAILTADCWLFVGVEWWEWQPQPTLFSGEVHVDSRTQPGITAAHFRWVTSVLALGW